jgi:hypothetical protein
MFNFNFFKSAPAEAQTQENSWNANTVAMQQPSSPAAPSTNQVVSEQPVRFTPSRPPPSLSGRDHDTLRMETDILCIG